MPSRFDWQAEDDSQWGELEPEKGSSPRNRLRSLRLVIIVLVLMAVAAGGAVSFARVERFLNESSADTVQVVLGVHNLVLISAAEGDSELFSGLILDRLHEWTDAQVQLAERGLLLDRRPLNLFLSPGTTPESVSVTLSASLGRAQVNADYRYRLDSDIAGADTVILRQLFTYRLDDGQWLLNPPTSDFWGPWQTISGRYLTLNYPQRDQQLALRLAADFEGVVGQVCHSIAELNCPADLHLGVDMVADPAVLVELSDPASRLKGDLNVDLPAPTLLGVPIDESGYRALFRAYAARIVAALIAEQTGVTCCETGLLGVALLDLSLNRLGLMTWSLEPGAVPATSDEVLTVAETLWRNELPLDDLRSDANGRTAYALVEFLNTSWSAVPVAEMLRLQAQAGSFQEWLAMLAPVTGEPSFSEAWRLFASQYNPKSAPEDGYSRLSTMSIKSDASWLGLDPPLSSHSMVQ